MATRVIDDSKLQNIAVAIQGKDGGGTMTVDEMPARIASMSMVLFSRKGRQYTRTVEIPNNVTTIDDFAFSDCTGLTNITFPDSLNTINQDAFGGCTGLTEIDLKNVTTIGTGAFGSCTGLTKIDLKNVTTFLGNYHFQLCSSLRKVIGKKVTSIGGSFYYCEALQTAILSNVSTIGQNTFLHANALENVDCRNVGRIADAAFSRCKRLSLIDLTSRATPTILDRTGAFYETNNTWIAVVANDTIKSDFQNATNWSTFASHFRTIAEVEAEVGMTYDEYYYQLFGEPRNEVTP